MLFRSLLSVYKYACEQNISVESCNFLQRPEYLRPSVLPFDVRQDCITQLQDWDHNFNNSSTAVINTRDPNHARQQISQDLESYVNYLKNEPDESFRLPEAVTFLKTLEASRGNSVLDYLPEYEQLFRSAGY